MAHIRKELLLRFHRVFCYMSSHFGLAFCFFRNNCCQFCKYFCFYQFCFNSLLISNISCNDHSAQYISPVIFIRRSVTEYISQHTVYYGQRIIRDKTITEYYLVRIFCFFFIGEIIYKVGTNNFFSCLFCCIDRCLIYVYDLPSGTYCK